MGLMISNLRKSKELFNIFNMIVNTGIAMHALASKNMHKDYFIPLFWPQS